MRDRRSPIIVCRFLEGRSVATRRGATNGISSVVVGSSALASKVANIRRSEVSIILRGGLVVTVIDGGWLEVTIVLACGLVASILIDWRERIVLWLETIAACLAETARVRCKSARVGPEAPLVQLNVDVGRKVLLLKRYLIKIANRLDVVLEHLDVRRVLLGWRLVNVSGHVVLLGHVWLLLELGRLFLILFTLLLGVLLVRILLLLDLEGANWITKHKLVLVHRVAWSVLRVVHVGHLEDALIDGGPRIGRRTFWHSVWHHVAIVFDNCLNRLLAFGHARALRNVRCSHLSRLTRILTHILCPFRASITVRSAPVLTRVRVSRWVGLVPRLNGIRVEESGSVVIIFLLLLLFLFNLLDLRLNDHDLLNVRLFSDWLLDMVIVAIADVMEAHIPGSPEATAATTLVIIVSTPSHLIIITIVSGSTLGVHVRCVPSGHEALVDWSILEAESLGRARELRSRRSRIALGSRGRCMAATVLLLGLCFCLLLVGVGLSDDIVSELLPIVIAQLIVM